MEETGICLRFASVETRRWLNYGQFPLRLDYCRSPHAYVNQRLQIQLELLMMSGVPLETCWAFNERWNNKFCYKVESRWVFLLNLTISPIKQISNIRTMPNQVLSKLHNAIFNFKGQYLLICSRNSHLISTYKSDVFVRVVELCSTWRTLIQFGIAVPSILYYVHYYWVTTYPFQTVYCALL
jgi:hypothetical protein